MQPCNGCKIIQMLDAGLHVQASGHVTQYFKPKYTKEFAILYLIVCVYIESMQTPTYGLPVMHPNHNDLQILSRSAYSLQSSNACAGVP